MPQKLNNPDPQGLEICGYIPGTFGGAGVEPVSIMCAVYAIPPDKGMIALDEYNRTAKDTHHPV